MLQRLHLSSCPRSPKFQPFCLALLHEHTYTMLHYVLGISLQNKLCPTQLCPEPSPEMFQQRPARSCETPTDRRVAVDAEVLGCEMVRWNSSLCVPIVFQLRELFPELLLLVLSARKALRQRCFSRRKWRTAEGKTHERLPTRHQSWDIGAAMIAPRRQP